MKLASVILPDGRQAAARVEGTESAGLVLVGARDVGELLQHPDWRALAGADGERVAMGDVRLRPVVPAPSKIICMGRNYAAHVAEMGHDLPEAPVLFSKHTASLTGPYNDIAMPAPSTQLDWEVELAFVVGRPGRRIPRERALDHVAGYTVANDFSVRDWQMRTNQWHAGKAWDDLTPLGPWLVTDDELPPGGVGIEVACEVDGVVMQEGNTSQFMFDVPALIADISTFTRLVPGDVVLTGTPSGVGVGRDPQVFLRPGQRVVTRIEGIGELRNTIVAGDV